VKNLKLLILAIGLTPVAAMITGVHKNKKRKVSRKCMLRFCLSTSKQCENSADWAFTSIGSKACGGPTGFVAYSLKLNTTEFPTKLKNTQIIRKNSIRNGGYFNL
jgi:hypothetical protein